MADVSRMFRPPLTSFTLRVYVYFRTRRLFLDLDALLFFLWIHGSELSMFPIRENGRNPRGLVGQNFDRKISATLFLLTENAWVYAIFPFFFFLIRNEYDVYCSSLIICKLDIDCISSFRNCWGLLAKYSSSCVFNLACGLEPFIMERIF